MNLVTNAIVLWNTIYMGKVIEQLESEGWDTEEVKKLMESVRDHMITVAKSAGP